MYNNDEESEDDTNINQSNYVYSNHDSAAQCQNYESESEQCQKEDESDESDTPVLAMSKQCRLDLEFLTDRTRMSRYLGKNLGKNGNHSVFGTSATDAHKMRKYDKYIQSKLRRLRTTVDKNYQIQRMYDALMREIVADIDRRLETIRQPNEEDSMFATVYNSDDEYILEVDQVEKERSEIRYADQIRVIRT